MHREQDDVPTILVVDDFEDFRLTLRVWLERRGYRVVEAGDGDKAIEVAACVHPSLILMDIGMPERSGISATYKIRENPKMDGIPIVAVTGYGSTDLHEDAVAAGCVTCLTKPVDFVELSKLLRRLLTTTGT